MKDTKTVYIALGSNKGDKFKNLQLAINAIFEKIGAIVSISKVYQTEAMGFDGDDFLNTCIAVNTNLSAKKVLNWSPRYSNLRTILESMWLVYKNF